MERHVETALGAYRKLAEIHVEQGKCDVCRQDGRVLCVDTSCGEYAELQICQACVAKYFGQSVEGGSK